MSVCKAVAIVAVVAGIGVYAALVAAFYAVVSFMLTAMVYV